MRRASGSDRRAQHETLLALSGGIAADAYALAELLGRDRADIASLATKGSPASTTPDKRLATVSMVS